MTTRREFLYATGAAGAATLVLPKFAWANAGKTLRVIPHADLSVLDPMFSTALMTLQHGYAVFDTLYGVDEDYNVRPQMVDGHEVSADELTWVLTLRDGLWFHDGAPVLASDVVASIRRWGARDALGGELLSVTEQLSAPDDKTVRFQLREPFPLLSYALGKPSANMLAIMPSRLAETDPGTQVTEMVGSGPFRFVADEWIAGSRVVYEKFDKYEPRQEPASFTAGGKVARVDRVELHVVPDAATAAAALMGGEVDVWEQAHADFVPSLDSMPTIGAVAGSLAPLNVLRVNHLQPPFDDPEVRRAVFSVIDQTEFMTAMGGTDPSRWTAGVGFFSVASPMSTDVGLQEALSGDMEAARQVIADSGFDLETPVVLLDPVDFTSLHAATLVAAKTLQELGLRVELEAVDWGTLVQRRSNPGTPQDGGWNLFVTGLTDMVGFDPSTNFALRGNGEDAWFGWPTSPVLEELRQEWLYTSDLSARQEIGEKMQLQAIEDLPYMPIGSVNIYNAISTRVQNFPTEFMRFYDVEIVEI